MIVAIRICAVVSVLAISSTASASEINVTPDDCGDGIVDTQWCLTTNYYYQPIGDSLALYDYDISNWDGRRSIHLADFRSGQNEVSIVSIWGGDTPAIPEPGTLGLLGLGLFCLGLLQRWYN